MTVVGYWLIADRFSPVTLMALVWLWLPALAICQGLGLGHFSFAGSTIPTWQVEVVMGAILYVYSLIFVVLLAPPKEKNRKRPGRSGFRGRA